MRERWSRKENKRKREQTGGKVCFVIHSPILSSDTELIYHYVTLRFIAFITIGSNILFNCSPVRKAFLFRALFPVVGAAAAQC